MITETDYPWTKEQLEKALIAASAGDGLPLRALCQKERQRFEAVIREHPDYADGLIQIEMRAVEGYLYQKLRGRLNEKAPPSNLPEERQDG